MVSVYYTNWQLQYSFWRIDFTYNNITILIAKILHMCIVYAYYNKNDKFQIYIFSSKEEDFMLRT